MSINLPIGLFLLRPSTAWTDWRRRSCARSVFYIGSTRYSRLTYTFIAMLYCLIYDVLIVYVYNIVYIGARPLRPRDLRGLC